MTAGFQRRRQYASHFILNSNMTKVFWFFGRSGAGKTTLARALYRALLDREIPAFYLDGDDLRSSLCANLTFTAEAQLENHRQMAGVAKLATGQNLNVAVSSMAPQHCQRNIVKQTLDGRLTWIYVHAPLDVRIKRNPKGLYQRAQAGKLDKLINYPFDAPRPHEREHYTDTVAQNVETASQEILDIVQAALSDFVI